jgi:pimeloyl-ACP methyl ester carboxylesterase
MSHLQFDLESPVWRHWIRGLSEQNTLIRYDERCCGLSSWDEVDVSFEAMVSDLETVVDTVGLDRFALLGVSQGCAVSVAYAIRHPERVSHLILYGGYVRGWHKVNQRRRHLFRRSVQAEFSWRRENNGGLDG